MRRAQRDDRALADFVYSHKNVLECAQALIMAMRKLGVDPEEPSNRVSRVLLLISPRSTREDVP